MLKNENMNLRSLIRPNIAALSPYTTARDEYSGGDISVWLDANESPFENGTNRYPDPRQKELKALIAKIKGVKPEQVFIGNGSDEAIDLAFRIFCRPGTDNAVSIAPTYGMYSVAAAINDIELREVRLNDDFTLDDRKLLQAADANTKLMWICSPNNPTGNAFPLSQLEKLADNFGGILVVDEAYADFSEKGSLLPVLANHPNLIILQTLSKAWGMAWLRLGLAFASPEIAAVFGNVKYPYNISGIVQQEVTKRLAQGAEKQIETIKAERQRLQRELPRCKAVDEVYPTDANFFLIRTCNADALYDKLADRGIMVRNRSRMPGCKGCLRITIGTKTENDRLLQALNEE